MLPKRASIHLAILSLVILLITGVFVTVISISYVALSSVLIRTAQDSLNNSCNKVSEQISNHLRPLNNNTSIAFDLLKNEVIKLKHYHGFTKFLHSTIVNDKHIQGALWGDINGNFYWLRKTEQNQLCEQVIVRHGNDYKHIENIFNNRLELLHTRVVPFDDVDPRLRPWYEQARTKKHFTWVIYKFLRETNEGTPLGVTAAFPLYDSEGHLLGVFGIDMLLAHLSNYIHDIKVTPNSVVFVIDDLAKLISVHKANGNLLENYEYRTIDGLKKPYLKKSLAIFQATHKTPFIFTIDNKKYISAYAKMKGTKGMSPWFVAIVTPIDDITAPLHRIILFALMVAGIFFVIGSILAYIFSSRISQPIKTLAYNANLICQLRFDEVKKITSHLLEIIEVDAAFMRMKHALSSFQLYVPSELVKKIVTDNTIVAPGGENKELTLLFADIKNFTHLSENIDPEKLMHLLSRYFQEVTEIVIATGGTVDKYIGDGIMAFWGGSTNDSPHSFYACKAALQIQDKLKQFSLEWQLENRHIISTRIGINTGNVVIGNVGSTARLNYTSVGDAVNLASRLEGLNKIYDTSIIIGEFTYNQIKNKFKFRLLDKVVVKGKTKGIYIYELLDDITGKEVIQLDSYNQDFLSAFTQYEIGNWQKALDLFNQLSNKCPKDCLLKIFIKRCLIFQKHPPKNWDGVWIIKEKL